MNNAENDEKNLNDEVLVRKRVLGVRVGVLGCRNQRFEIEIVMHMEFEGSDFGFLSKQWLCFIHRRVVSCLPVGLRWS